MDRKLRAAVAGFVGGTLWLALSTMALPVAHADGTTATLTGSVVGPDGLLLKNPTVTVYTPSGSTVTLGQPGAAPFTLTVAPGTYALKFSDGTGADAAEYWEDKTTLATADQITLVAGQTFDVGTVQLAANPTLSGTVAGPNGQGLAHGSVTAYNATTGAYVTQISVAAGSFSAPVAAGSYKLKYTDSSGVAGAQWYKGRYSQATADAVDVSADTMLDPVQLQAKPLVSGTVKDTANNPIATGTVQTYLNGSSTGTVPIINGQWAALVDPGSYTFRFTDTSGHSSSRWYLDQDEPASATAVMVTADKVLGPEHLQVLPALTGEVVDERGDAVAGTIYAYPQQGDGSYSPYNYSTLHFDSARSNELAGLQTGNYKLQIVPNVTSLQAVYWQGASDFATAKPVAITDAGVDLGRVTLIDAPVIRATVTDGAGNPLAGTWTLDSPTGSYIRGANFTAGQATIPVPGPGSYKVSFSATGYQTVYYGGTSLATATLVDVSAAGTTLDPIVMTNNPALTGSVTDTWGRPIATAQIKVFSSGSTSASGTYAVHADGTFTLPLASGTYQLDISDPVGGHIEEWYDNATSQAASTAVAFSAANDLPLNPIVLAGGPPPPDLAGTVAGKVAGRDGIPLDGVSIKAYATTSSTVVVATTVTGRDGTFQLTDLPAGVYRIQAIDPTGEYLAAYVGGSAVFLTATDITVTGGGTVTGADAVLDPAPTGTQTGVDLHGTVADDAGHGVGDTVVYAYLASGAPSDAPVAEARTNRHGAYSFSYLDPTEPTGYKLRAVPDNTGLGGSSFAVQPGWRGGIGFATATTVTVDPASTTPAVDIALARYGGITGTIAAADGSSVTGGYVTFFDGDGLPVGGAAVAADGSYATNAVTPGTRYVEGAADGLVRAYYSHGYSLQTATPVTVKPGAFARADLTLDRTIAALTTPSVRGAPHVGSVLTATAGTWSLTNGVALRLTWLRDGTIAIGSGYTHRVTAADAGHRLTVRVVATRASLTGHSTSAPTAILTYLPRLAVTGASPRRGVVRLTVHLGLSVQPGGTYTVTRGGKTLRVVVARPNVKITLRHQRPGRQTYRVTLARSRLVSSSTASTTVNVR